MIASIPEQVISDPVTRTETQAHGFVWEKELLTNVYGATKEELDEIKYNSKMDLPSNLNRLDGCDISVKSTGSKNSVCMGDCLRVFDAVSSDTHVHMVVVHYIQSTETTKTVKSIAEVDLTNSVGCLFGNLTREKIKELDVAVKSVPTGRSPTAEEKTNIRKLASELQLLSGAMKLNIKWDSKTQRRLQCSFNQFGKFIEENPDRVIAQSNTHEFRGGKIAHTIVSSRRIRKRE